MRVVILGAGVIGTTLAYELAKQGYEIALVDRGEGPATECSFSNGGQLSYSHAEPWASPNILLKVLSWIGKEDAPLLFNLRYDPKMWYWALQFLRNCTTSRNQQGTRLMLALALYSRDCMQYYINDAGLTFDYTNQGILHIFTNKKNIDHALSLAKFQEKLGCPFTYEKASDVLESEPLLRYSKDHIIGGIRYPIDAVGDAFLFTKALFKQLSVLPNFTAKTNTVVEELVIKNGQIDRVKTNQGDIQGDCYVMALGADSPLLLKPCGIHVPIYPMKGYSITVSTDHPDKLPQIGITDQERKIVYSRVGNRLRVAGTAEFVGYNTEINERRIEPIKQAVRVHFPNLTEVEEASTWSCLRPSTPDGLPILGKTSIKNLILNTGHGSLGWTLAAGSAAVVVSEVERYFGKPSESRLLPPADFPKSLFAVDRF